MDLYCFDYSSRTVRIKRGFFNGDTSPVVASANYIANVISPFSSQFEYQIMVLFSDMEENVNDYIEGLKALHQKATRSRIKVVGAIPEENFDYEKPMLFRRYFPAVPITASNGDVLMKQLLDMMKIIRVF